MKRTVLAEGTFEVDIEPEGVYCDGQAVRFGLHGKKGRLVFEEDE